MKKIIMSAKRKKFHVSIIEACCCNFFFIFFTGMSLGFGMAAFAFIYSSNKATGVLKGFLPAYTSR